MNRLKRKVAAKYQLDFGRGFGALIFVAGSGRSGTTWVAELLNADNRHRLVFEPFEPEIGAREARQLPTYIRVEETDAQLLDAARTVLLGKFAPTSWTGRDNNRVVSTSRIIKDIDSNLRLGWIREQFPGFPILLVIRHPCAVAASRERLRDLGDTRSAVRWLPEILEDPRIVEDHLGPFLETLREIDTPFEAEVARWCIETYVPLRQLGGRPDVTAFLFEHLLSDRPGAIEALFRAARQTPSAPAWETFAQPSSTAFRREKPLNDTGQAVTDWTGRLDAEHIDRALELVRMFGLDTLYDEGPEPRIPRDADVLAAARAAMG